MRWGAFQGPLVSNASRGHSWRPSLARSRTFRLRFTAAFSDLRDGPAADSASRAGQRARHTVRGSGRWDLVLVVAATTNRGLVQIRLRPTPPAVRARRTRCAIAHTACAASIRVWAHKTQGGWRRAAIHTDTRPVNRERRFDAFAPSGPP